MAAIKLELTDELKNIIYFHTSSDIVYFNSRLASGISSFNVQDAMLELNNRVNEMIILNEDMQKQVYEMRDKVVSVVNSMDEKVTMFSLTSYLARDGWKDTNGKVPYTQKVITTGVKDTDEVLVGPVQSAEYNVAQTQVEAYNCISRTIVNNGSISFICYQDVPRINIPVKILVLRKEATKNA